MLNINHPLIQKCFEIYYGNHNFKLLTEYFKLDTLRETIDKNSIEFDETELDDEIEQDSIQDDDDIKFDDTQKLMIIYGIASAMSYLHSRNINYGDLNTSNILLDYKFRPKLVNYGIKSVFKEKSFKRNCFDEKCDDISKITHLYNINSKEYDIHSFALVAYEIITSAKLAKPLIFFDDYEHYKNCLDYHILPKVYCSLIQKCLSSNPPTFDEIVHELKENPRFITDTIDEYEYRNFIKFIESSIRKPELKNNKYEIIENSKNTIISFKNKNENKQQKYKVTNIKQINTKKYKIEYKIGEGGFAVVSLVIKKNENDKIYALKEFKKDEYIKIYDTNSEKYIFREIYYTSNLNNPAINKAIGYTPFDSIHDQDKIAILMHYKPKGSLDKEIKGMDDVNKLIVVYGIAAGMSYIHSQNVIHRDLKAENILIDNDFKPLITDLGMAI